MSKRTLNISITATCSFLKQNLYKREHFLRQYRGIGEAELEKRIYFILRDVKQQQELVLQKTTSPTNTASISTGAVRHQDVGFRL